MCIDVQPFVIAWSKSNCSILNPKKKKHTPILTQVEELDSGYML